MDVDVHVVSLSLGIDEVGCHVLWFILLCLVVAGGVWVQDRCSNGEAPQFRASAFLLPQAGRSPKT